MTIELLIRGDENTQYALSRQETVLVEGFRKLSDEAKDEMKVNNDGKKQRSDKYNQRILFSV